MGALQSQVEELTETYAPFVRQSWFAFEEDEPLSPKPKTVPSSAQRPQVSQARTTTVKPATRPTAERATTRETKTRTLSPRLRPYTHEQTHARSSAHAHAPAAATHMSAAAQRRKLESILGPYEEQVQ